MNGPDLRPFYYNDGEAQQVIMRRVCARCYGELISKPSPEYRPDNHSYIVYCPTCEDAWNYATISRSYAECLGQVAIANRWEVEKNLPDLFPPHPRRSEAQILHSLGF